MSVPAGGLDRGELRIQREALGTARQKNKKAASGRVLEPGHKKLGIAHRYYAYDGEVTYIGRDIHADEWSPPIL